MLKIEMKDKETYIDIVSNTKESTLFENLTLLHIALNNLKTNYNMDIREVSDVYKLYKKYYKDSLKEVS